MWNCIFKRRFNFVSGYAKSNVKVSFRKFREHEIELENEPISNCLSVFIIHSENIGKEKIF